MNSIAKLLFVALSVSLIGCGGQSAQIAKLKNELTISSETVSELKNEVADLRQSADSLRGKNENLNTQITALQDSLDDSNQKDKSEIGIIDPVAHLFSTTWKANKTATMNYSANAGDDKKELQSYAWSYAIQSPTTATFFDDGIELAADDGKINLSLTAKSRSFAERVKLIDRYHFALKDGKHWLVFRAMNWENDNYKFEK